MRGSLTDPDELTVARGHALRTPKMNGLLTGLYQLTMLASKTLERGHAVPTRK